jgi:hypothetical protein
VVKMANLCILCNLWFKTRTFKLELAPSSSTASRTPLITAYRTLINVG